MKTNIIIEDIKKSVISEIEEIEKIKEGKYKIILMLCFLESYAQLNIFYNKKSNKESERFKTFIKDFFPTNYWDEFSISNVLYHRINKKFLIKKQERYKFRIKIKKVLDGNKNNLSSIVENKDIVLIKDEILSKYSKTIKEIDRYKIIELLYKYRSKLIHNFELPGALQLITFTEDFPRYNTVDVWKGKKYKSVNDLVFPYNFIKKLTQDSINNYLEKCNKERKNPYSNYVEKLNWYER